MSRTNTNAHRGPLLGIAVVAMIVMALIFFLATYLNAGISTESTPTDGMTSSSANSSITIDGTVGPSEMDLVDTSKSASPLDPGKVVPGDKVRVINGSDSTRLYSDANLNALIMDQLADGGYLIVLEPSSEYDAYPVENDGKQWVRVRAVDGLVGWVDASKLTE